MSHNYVTESIIYIHEVFIYFDNTRMSMSMVHLLYDQNALQIQRMCVLASGSILYKVT